MNSKRALKKIALQNDMSILELEKEIQSALDTGRCSPDPSVQEYWRCIPHNSYPPTVEEVVAYLAAQIRQKSGK